MSCFLCWSALCNIWVVFVCDEYESVRNNYHLRWTINTRVLVYVSTMPMSKCKNMQLSAWLNILRLDILSWFFSPRSLDSESKVLNFNTHNLVWLSGRKVATFKLFIGMKPRIANGKIIICKTKWLTKCNFYWSISDRWC